MKTQYTLARFAAMLSVAAAALTPSIGGAQSACYVPGSGTVYRIKEPNTPTQCSTGHVEFQLTAAAKPSSGGGGGPTGAAGGDLGGSYPNPSVVKIQGQPISTTVPASGQVLTFSGGNWTPTTPAAASLPTNGAGAYDLSNLNGFVANATLASGNFPASGAGSRLVWIPGLAALRAGTVTAAQWDVAAVGQNSTAFGYNVTASGARSTALGDNNQATATASTALGSHTTAGGANSVAAGAYSTANGLGAIALGWGASAGGAQAAAIGLSDTASGINAIAMGHASRAIGDYSFAAGNATTASASFGMAFGFATVANGLASTAMGQHANTSGMQGSFVYGDGSTVNVVGVPLDNSFVVRAQHFWFGTTSAPTAPSGHLIETSTGAYLSTGGTWTNTSDANKKHAFKTVDAEDVLARIDSMPVSTWTYNTEADSVRHMGPTAQDFRKAFGLGDTDKAIATVDADGVSLAAIKALLQRTTELRKENDELKAMIAELAQRLSQLEQARR